MNNMEIVGKPKRKRVEIFLVAVVLIIAALVLGIKIQMSDKLAKENALMSELRAVRSSVELYIVLNKNIPPDLSSLVTQKYSFGDRQDTYLKGIKLEKGDQPIDSFGNKFNYDPKTGRVWPGTRGYEKW